MCESASLAFLREMNNPTSPRAHVAAIHAMRVCANGAEMRFWSGCGEECGRLATTSPHTREDTLACLDVMRECTEFRHEVRALACENLSWRTWLSYMFRG
jgi:hypothetical protein